MKLLNNKYNFYYEFDDEKINILVCESPNIYCELVQNLYNASNNSQSSFVLSHNSMLLDFSKYCDIILNPFQLDVNNKRNIEKLYLRLLLTIEEQGLYINKNELLSNLLEFINKVSFLSNYNISHIDIIDFKSILKALDIKLQLDSDSFVEYISDYMKVSRELQGEKIFIFINLKSFITMEQINELYKVILYNKSKVLLFENVDSNYNAHELKIIIDKDGCIIT